MSTFLLIPDSFKGTVSSLEACEIMQKCINRHFPDCRVISVPIAVVYTQEWDFFENLMNLANLFEVRIEDILL